MTQQRRDGNSTEFRIWTRQQGKIDSSLGFVTTNLDFVWKNSNTGDWLFLEEKRNRALLRQYQYNIFKHLHELCLVDSSYHGFYFIEFENTNPTDGRMWLHGDADGIEINYDDLISFLQFKHHIILSRSMFHVHNFGVGY